MRHLILCVSALLLTSLTAMAQPQEPVLTPGTYIFGGGTSLLSKNTRANITESGFMGGIGLAGKESQRRVGTPAWELAHFQAEGNRTTLSATGLSYIERSPTTHGARSYYGFGLGVASLRVTLKTNESTQNTTRASVLPPKDTDGIRVTPTFLLGTPLGSKAFLEARYTGLGSLSGVRADQYSLSLGIRL